MTTDMVNPYTDIGEIPRHLRQVQGTLVRTGPNKRNWLIAIPNVNALPTVYSLSGTLSLASYCGGTVALRKAYSELSGIPLSRINTAVAKARKQWEKDNWAERVEDMKRTANHLGFDIVPRDSTVKAATSG